MISRVLKIITILTIIWLYVLLTYICIEGDLPKEWWVIPMPVTYAIVVAYLMSL